jgi:hypothetical protein
MDDIILIIDTSIFRKHISLNTHEFELIAELSRINAIKFKIPEMVEKEMLSQKIAEYEVHYDKIISSLRQLHSKDNNVEIQCIEEIEKFIAAKDKTIIELEKNWRTYKREKNISIIPFSFSSTNKVFHDYFKGNPPFKNLKNRNDLPDAFILHSILSVHDKKMIYFVSADNTLSESAIQNGIKTYGSLSEILELSEIKLKIKDLENISSVNTEFELIKSSESELSEYVSNHLTENIPVELYNSKGNSSRHKDKLVKINEIKSVSFDFNKARLYDSQFLVILASIDTSIEIEMVYTKGEYLKRTSQNSIEKIFELLKQGENEEGIVVKEPFSGKLNLTLKFDLSPPFEIKKDKIIFSDVTKEFLSSDILYEIFK